MSAYYLGAAPSPAPFRSQGCHQAFLSQFDVEAAQGGPLQLDLISCIGFESRYTGTGRAFVSPDAERVARWASSVDLASLEEGEAVQIPNQVTLKHFTTRGGSEYQPDSIAWARDSQSVLAVEQDVLIPSGFSLSEKRPIRIDLSGQRHALPRLAHRAGPLDAIMWVGGNGLALAQFGTRGAYYRPEHVDPDPTIAIVDAMRGRVLDELRAEEIPGLSFRLRQQLFIGDATATTMRDGRVRAVFQFGPWRESSQDNAAAGPWAGLWLVWTQGRRPTPWPAPYPEERSNPAVITPDGSRLLVVRQLQPAEPPPICPRIPPCVAGPPPTPRVGPVAELHDVESRRILWRLPVQVDQHWQQDLRPAISPDGHFALIGIPPEGERAMMAIVNLRRGTIVERFSLAHRGSYGANAGFTANGRRIWVTIGNVVYLYNFMPH